jgi:hypothetical protein
MPPVDPLIIQKLSTDLDVLQSQLESVASNLSNQLLTRMADLAEETNEFIGAFEQGEDVSKQVISQVKSLQKEVNRLNFQRIKDQQDLTKAVQAGNIREQERLRTNLRQNSILQDQYDRHIEILNVIQQEAEAEAELAKKRKEEEERLAAQSKKRLDLARQYLVPQQNLLAIFGSIFKNVLGIDTQVTNLSRSLGVSYNSAKGIRNEMESFAKGAKDGFTTVARLVKAQSDLTEQLGIAVDFGNEERQQFAQLTELVGLSADEAGKLASFSASAGMSTSDYVKNVRSAGMAAQQANKIHISDKQLLQSISKLSAGILVKFQGNPKALAEAVVQAKKFGTTLEQVDKTGESLLNWETSIENELKAELITGKQLNLERARAAALTGDQATLMQEVASQAGSLAEFQDMNVIAQRSLAEAFGMSSDEMADMLMKQEAINKYGSAAEELTAQQLKDFEKSGMSLDDYLKKQDKQVDIQTKFNTAMERLQEIVGNIAAGPLGKFASLMADILSSSWGLYAAMGLYIARLGTSIALQIVSARVAKKNAAANIVGAAAEAAQSAAAIPVIGWGLAAGAALAIAGTLYGLMSDSEQKVQDGIAPPGKGPFTITDKFGATAITAEGDGIAVSPNISKGEGESISVSSSVNKGGSSMDMTPLTAAINELRSAVNALANKPAPAMAIQVGAEKLGEVVGKQAETGTNQYKNAYKLA